MTSARCTSLPLEWAGASLCETPAGRESLAQAGCAPGRPVRGFGARDGGRPALGPDRDVWEYAKTRGFIIVSADSDFYESRHDDRPAAESSVAATLDTPDQRCRDST